ncbi:hypothetical protein O6H91_13G041600 [Diphasiastrum complanatum]|uniref:Uncharacterized protein n=1 Tax=Diphasiastrum complanatum TaxID=34168 RepID=A0ACC2BV94_DIPCM|nr:hypothetical protein O6H91_13G041600 [Diphasiastrum complanatum]
MKIIKSTASSCFGSPILGRSRSISWLKSYSKEYISPPSSYYGTLISDFCRFDSSEGALNNKASSSVSDSPSTLQLKSMGLYSLSKTVSFPSTKSYACNSNTDSESTEMVDSSSYNQPLPLKIANLKESANNITISNSSILPRPPALKADEKTRKPSKAFLGRKYRQHSDPARG